MKLDIRTRLFMAAGMSVYAVIIQDPVVLTQLLALNIAILIILRVSLAGLSKQAFKLWTVILILLFVGSIFQPSGKTLLAYKDLDILTTGGIKYGVSVALRLAIITGSGLLFFSSGIRELVPALSKARIPYEILFMVQVSCRFLPLFTQEISNTINAVQLRGVDLKKVHLRKSFKILSFVLVPLLYSIWQKAQELAMVMEARGFRAYPDRTNYREVFMRPIDYIVLVVFVSLLICITLINTVVLA